MLFYRFSYLKSSFTLPIRLRLFSSTSDATASELKGKATPQLIKIINSHEKICKETGQKLNEIREKELEEYRKKMGATRKLYAESARKVPTRSEREIEDKQVRRETNLAKWSKFVEGLKKCSNPPVTELQSSGKIPAFDAERAAQKAQRGMKAFKKSLKQPTLMRRKYLNYLAQEIVPNLVTRENLDAKIQEAVEGATVKSFNLTADAFVQEEERVKLRLKQIKVDMSF